MLQLKNHNNLVEAIPLHGVFPSLPESRASSHSFDISLPPRSIAAGPEPLVAENPKTLSDFELVERVAVGRSEAAFSELYDRFARDVYNLFRKVLKSELDAQDLLQEVFLQIWNKAPEFYQHRGNPSGWIITLARNRMLDELRSKRYRKRKVEQTLVVQDERPEIQSLVETTTTPDAYMTSLEAQSEIRRALKTLTRDQRELVDLAYFAGLSYSEIATKQGIPLGTVKTRMRQTVKKLADVVKPRM